MKNKKKIVGGLTIKINNNHIQRKNLNNFIIISDSFIFDIKFFIVDGILISVIIIIFFCFPNNSIAVIINNKKYYKKPS
jgi:hypothetical protein